MKQKSFLSLVIPLSIVLTVNACKTAGINTAEDFGFATTSSEMDNTDIDNTLSEAEKKQGYILLFDGKSTKGWRTYQHKPENAWSVKDGNFYCKGDSGNKSDLRADMITDDQFQDFDFSIDWKISPQGNSGIIYLSTEEFSTSYLSGPEYQIIDDKNFPEKLEDWQKTGANYAMNPAPDAAPNPIGEWNTTRILVNKGHVEHWLNGKKIVEYEMGSDDWKKRKMEGKWKDAAGYGLAKSGHIALQDHGSEAWFKNIKIKKL